MTKGNATEEEIKQNTVKNKKKSNRLGCLIVLLSFVLSVVSCPMMTANKMERMLESNRKEFHDQIASLQNITPRWILILRLVFLE